MARSSYIYIILVKGKVFSAHTVKYEMESNLPDHPDGKIQVLRVKDSDSSIPPCDITNEYYE